MRRLIPLSVCIYTVVGGLKATFTSSYLHTVIIYVTVCLFAFKFYASDLYPVGSISKVWDNLNIMAEGLPVAGTPSLLCLPLNVSPLPLCVSCWPMTPCWSPAVLHHSLCIIASLYHRVQCVVRAAVWSEQE